MNQTHPAGKYNIQIVQYWLDHLKKQINSRLSKKSFLQMIVGRYDADTTCALYQ